MRRQLAAFGKGFFPLFILSMTAALLAAAIFLVSIAHAGKQKTPPVEVVKVRQVDVPAKMEGVRTTAAAGWLASVLHSASLELIIPACQEPRLPLKACRPQ
jgi:hypothetical protein